MIELQFYIQGLWASSDIFFTMLLEKVQRANGIDISLFA